MNKKSIHIIGGIAGIIVIVVVVGFLRSRAGYSSIDYGDEKASSFATSSRLVADFDTNAEALPYGIIEEPTAGPIGGDIEQKIIRNGSIELVVDSIADTLTNIGEIAKRHGGLVQQSNAGERANGTRYAAITIRVPFEAYDAAVVELKATAIKVTSETSNAQDVTEQYTDLQAQLKVAREEEQAFLRLLDRSASVSDLLQVQRELSQVRTRIESLQGRIQYLDNQTSLSTLTISLKEEATLNVPTKPFRPGSSITNALQSLVVIGQNVVIFLIWAVVLGIGIGVPAYVLYRIGRPVYRKLKK